MRIGGRFDVGGPFPSALPAELIQRVREVEATLPEAEKSTRRWTLTWLENRPVLTLDGGAHVSLD